MTKIVLDPGHGGKDSGALGNGLVEKDLTLKAVLEVGKLLASFYEVEVHYTRTTDKFLSLTERSNLSDNLKADFFISFHINASGGSGYGYEEFIWNGNVGAKTIELQKKFHENMVPTLKSLGIRDRGSKKANYAVLRETNAPAILIENLFIDHTGDANILKNSYSKLLEAEAHALAKAIGLKTKQKAPVVAPKPVPAPTTPSTSKTLYRVIVDGKQVGAFADIQKAIAEAMKNNPTEVRIQKV